MGSFIVNFQARAKDRTAVERALEDFGVDAAWVTGSKNGWVSVYEQGASKQDDRRIRALGERLSASLAAPVIAFLVHDSDFVCYWLYDQGKLLDEFNSSPDYFDEDESGDAGQHAGQPDVLLKYCVAGTTRAHVESVLANKDHVFADHHLTELAAVLGIDQGRACMDFEYVEEKGPAALDATFVGSDAPGKPAANVRPAAPPAAAKDDDDDRDDDPDGDETSPSGPKVSAGKASEILSKMMQTLGLGAAKGPVDPQVEQLAQAASDNNIPEIERLVALGADINGEAPVKPAHSSPLAARMLSGGGAGIRFPATPLMAAISHRREEATRRLLELGADVNHSNPIFGTAVHAASGGGNPTLLRLLLDRGGDVHALNVQRQTPLALIRHLRGILAQLRSMTSLGALAAAKAELDKMLPAPEALDECERLLMEHGAT